jgi:hypothetical protein
MAPSLLQHSYDMLLSTYARTLKALKYTGCC